MRVARHSGLRILAAVLATATLPSVVCAQGTTESPAELVRRTVHNEIASANGSKKFMFRDHKETAHGSQTKLLVETSQTMVGLIVANNDLPLSPAERQAEQIRVERFVKNPQEIEKRAKQEKENTQLSVRILRALPDAFLYEGDGTQAGADDLGKTGRELVRLKFRPNPNYVPPGREERLLTGLQGFILIDTTANRIALMDGTLFRSVEFGWGILGRLDQGGRFVVQQADVGDGHWEVTRMRLSFNGKIVLFKNLVIRSNEVFSDFREVPSTLTYAQGLELLEKQQAELAEGQQQGAQK